MPGSPCLVWLLNNNIISVDPFAVQGYFLKIATMAMMHMSATCHSQPLTQLGLLNVRVTCC